MNVTLSNDLADLPRLAAAVADFSAQHRLSPHDGFELELVLEEIFTNIVSYAFPERGRHAVELHLELDAGGVMAEILDAGRPFDPLDVAPPDLAADIEHRPIGGLGIHFVRTLTEDLAYERRAGINHLSFRKRLRQADGDRRDGD